ncbi:syntaxin binding protein 1 [Coemansia sp. RSA 2050]|nr:syntaxin binding protein 1 [Coemansia sp. RSA 2050]
MGLPVRVAVQLISKNRQPYPDVDAVYVLVPCAESIAQVIDDFTPTTDPPLRAKYARAHLFFSGALPDPLFTKLSASAAAPYIKGIAELYIEYNPIESRVFLTTPSERPFYALYSPNASGMRSRDLEASADRVLSVIASLGIRPYIRYYRPPGPASSPAEAMANCLQSKLDSYCAHLRRKAENYKEGQSANLLTSTIIVLDRSVDIYAPLIHDFAYQAMVHDLIDLESGDKYTNSTVVASGETQRTETELAEATDPLWAKLRHQHISHVSQTLVKRLDQLVSENVGIKALSSLSKRPTLNEMSAALAELPEFKRLQSSELISHPAGYIYEKSEESLLEPRLIALLDDRTLSATDRIRLLFLYLVHVNGGIALDRRRLEEVPQCLTDDDKLSAVNLCRLGVLTKVESQADVQPSSRSRYTWEAINRQDQDELGPCFVPAVKRIIGEHIAGTLNTEMFPWVQQAPPEGIPRHIVNTNATSMRSKRGGWESRQHGPQKPAACSDLRGTLIVYIAGGVTLGEMRAVYEIAHKYNRQVYIGSTHVITPRGFLDDLKSLHL